MAGGWVPEPQILECGLDRSVVGSGWPSPPCPHILSIWAGEPLDKADSWVSKAQALGQVVVISPGLRVVLSVK